MPKQKGFTLIEILVVVVILAVLGTIGAVYYGNLQAKARDASRRFYVNSIAKAFEVNKNVDSYQPLQIDQITMLYSADPVGTVYCVAPSLIPDPAFSVSWEGTCPAGFEIVAVGVPTTGPFTSFKVCTYLEQPGSGNPNVFCKSGSI